jgi:hypothetical protein
MVAVDLQYAQNHAIASQKVVRVVFTPANSTTGDRGGYTVQYKDAPTLINHPVNKGPYTVNFTAMKEFAALKLVSAYGCPPVPATGVNGYVEFDPIGAPNRGGTVVVEAGTSTYTITVAAVTGKITVN